MQHINDVEVMALTNFKVRFVVSRSYFQGSGAKFDIHMIISNDTNFSLGKRTPYFGANQVGIALILGINRHGGVTHQGFRTRG